VDISFNDDDRDVGRRSGKTRIAAAISVYIAAIEQRRNLLGAALGDHGMLMMLTTMTTRSTTPVC
jgi:hypothetical protein